MYILFGAGELGKKVLNLLGKNQVAYFLDNDKEKEGKEINGTRVFSVDMKINDLEKNRIVITTSKKNELDIRQQLKIYGIRDVLSVNEQLYDGLDEYHKAIAYYQGFGFMPADSHIYYGGLSEFSTKEMFPDQYKKEYDLLMNRFLPRMTFESCLADVGCADGHWTREVSEHCKKIDGYDFSDKLINTAKNRYENDTTRFYKWDARKDDLNQKYDGVMMLGLLMYLFDDEDIYALLEKIRNSMDEKGILVTKDTLNITEKKICIPTTQLQGMQDAI